MLVGRLPGCLEESAWLDPQGQLCGLGALYEYAFHSQCPVDLLGEAWRKLCAVVIDVKEEPSSRRGHQPFEVLSTGTISHKALEADI